MATDAFGLPVYSLGKKGVTKKKYSNDYSRFNDAVKDVPDEVPKPNFEDIMKEAAQDPKAAALMKAGKDNPGGPKPGFLGKTPGSKAPRAPEKIEADLKHAREMASKAGSASSSLQQKLKEMELAAAQLKEKEDALTNIQNPEDLINFMKSQGMSEEDLEKAFKGDHSMINKVLNDQFDTGGFQDLAEEVDKAGQVAEALKSGDIDGAEKAFEQKEAAAKTGGKKTASARGGSGFSFGKQSKKKATSGSTNSSSSSKAASVSAEEITTGGKKASSSQYNFDYSRFDDVSKDEDEEASSSAESKKSSGFGFRNSAATPAPLDECDSDDDEDHKGAHPAALEHVVAAGRMKPKHDIEVNEEKMELIASFVLSNLTNGMQEVDLDVAETSMQIQSPAYFLRERLPYRVDPDTSKAKFSKKTSTLKVTCSITGLLGEEFLKSREEQQKQQDAQQQLQKQEQQKK